MNVTDSPSKPFRAFAVEPVQNDAMRVVPYVDADPLAVRVFCGYERRSTTRERVQHCVALVRTGPDHSLVQGERLLCGVTCPFLCGR